LIDYATLTSTRPIIISGRTTYYISAAGDDVGTKV